MPVDPDIAQTVPETSAADAWAARKLEILSELAEAGLEIAQALKIRIIETAASEPDAGNAQACADLSRAFDRTSRAVRLSIALRDKLQKDAARPEAARNAEDEPRHQRAERVRRIVRRVVRARFKEEVVREAFDRHVSERLHDRDITGDLAAHSIGALVARICADLGIAPRWLQFAEEAWAQTEITERPPGSPYAAWPDLPPEDPWDPEDDFEDEDEPEESAGGGPERVNST